MFIVAYTDYAKQFHVLSIRDTEEEARDQAKFYTSHGTKNVQVYAQLAN